MNINTFYTWLVEQRDRQDGTGDLGKFFYENDDVPDHKTKYSLLNYLVWKTEYDPVLLEAFDKAWIEYKRYRTLIF